MKIKCIVIDDDRIQRELIGSYVKETTQLQLISSFSNALEARSFLEDVSVDLIFLDIEMPLMSGLEFLNSIRNKPNVVLITSEEKYALESYTYDVVDYLLKPVPYVRFAQAINKVVGLVKPEIDTSESINEIFVKVNSVIERIKLIDILFIEAAVDYIQVFTSDKKLLVSATMNSILKKLPKDDFIRVHRSHIIRVDKVNKIDGDFISIKDKIIRVSKSYKEDFMNRINALQ